MKGLGLYCSIPLFALHACATIGMRSGYTDWDTDGNGQLSQHEFVRGYRISNYFSKWHHSAEITESEFYTAIFRTVDQNNDSILSCNEFRTQIDYAAKGTFPRDCGKWDLNKDQHIVEEEFIREAGKLQLLSVWDTSGDSMISENEMARGMFALCDLDEDGRVNVVEFNVWDANR